MNFIKSFFTKTPTPQKQQVPQKQQQQDSSILDPSFYQVRLRDIKILFKDAKKLEQILKYYPETLNEQLKISYTLHVLLSSDQVQAIDKIIQTYEFHQIKPSGQNLQTKSIFASNINQTCNVMLDQNNIVMTQGQNSMFLNVSDQIQLFEQINQNEQEFTNIYFNYIQRIIQNSDIYNSCKFHQYPYQEETQQRKIQFLWLFKIINLLNFKLSIIPYLETSFKHKTQNTLIIRDIAYMVYKDCLLEYGFVRNEVTDMMESYSQFQVKESIQFFELIVILQDITKKMKKFYDMRLQFALNSASVRDVKWFVIEKKQLIEIENFVSKAKLLNSSQFKKSLQVPTQKIVMENLHRILQNPELIQQSDLKEPVTGKHNKRTGDLLYSPLNSNQMKKSEHTRQPSANYQIH